jgi:hypothetical protein
MNLGGGEVSCKHAKWHRMGFITGPSGSIRRHLLPSLMVVSVAAWSLFVRQEFSQISERFIKALLRNLVTRLAYFINSFNADSPVRKMPFMLVVSAYILLAMS